MSLVLKFLLEMRRIKFKTELDYRLTQLELYELGADDDIANEFREYWDNGGWKNG